MLNLQIIIDGEYKELRHTHPIKQVGFIYPKNGVVARIQEGHDVSHGGNEFRIHTNGDQFAWSGYEWFRVYDIDTVDFIPKKF